MLLLTQTKALYAAFRSERSATDVAVLQLREFLTNQFGHDGTKAWKEVDEQTHTRQKQKPGERSLRRFQHPLATRQVAASQVKQGQPIPVTEITERTVGEQNVGPTVVNEAGVRQEDGSVTPLQEYRQNLPDEPITEEQANVSSNPSDVPGGGDAPGKSEVSEGDSNENLPSTSTNLPEVVADNLLIDLQEVAKVKAKTAAGKYSRDQLVATLKNYNIAYKEDGSNTQLAANLISYANQNVD